MKRQPARPATARAADCRGEDEWEWARSEIVGKAVGRDVGGGTVHPSPLPLLILSTLRPLAPMKRPTTTWLQPLRATRGLRLASGAEATPGRRVNAALSSPWEVKGGLGRGVRHGSRRSHPPLPETAGRTRSIPASPIAQVALRQSRRSPAPISLEPPEGRDGRRAGHHCCRRGLVRQTRRIHWHPRHRFNPRDSAERGESEHGADHEARPRSPRPAPLSSSHRRARMLPHCAPRVSVGPTGLRTGPRVTSTSSTSPRRTGFPSRCSCPSAAPAPASYTSRAVAHLSGASTAQTARPHPRPRPQRLPPRQRRPPDPFGRVVALVKAVA